MAKADASEILAETASMAEHSPDYDEILQGLLHIWHRASLAQVVPDAIDNAEGDREAILQLSMAMPAEDLQLCYQIALQGRQDLAMAPEPRQGFEMILLRMLAFRPAPDVVPELDLVSALEKKKPLTTVPSETKADPEIGLNAESKTETAVDDAQGIPVAEAAATESVISEPAALQASETAKPSPQPFPQASASHAAPVQDPPGDAETADTGVNSYSDAANTEESDSTEADQADDHVDSVDDVRSVDDVTEAANPERISPEATKPELIQTEPVKSADVRAGGAQDRRDGSLADLMDKPVEAAVTAGASQNTEQPTPDVNDAGGVTSVDELPELAPHTWHMWVDHLALAGLPMAIARNSALIKRDDSSGAAVLEFDVDPAQGALYNDTQRERITAALRELLPGVTLIMTLTATRGETPEQRRQRLLADALYSARQAIDSDPLVDQIINELGGQVIEDTVRPNT